MTDHLSPSCIPRSQFGNIHVDRESTKHASPMFIDNSLHQASLYVKCHSPMTIGTTAAVSSKRKKRMLL